jgi:hypothetical protein
MLYKTLPLALFMLSTTALAAGAENDTYTCRLFEPSPTGGKFTDIKVDRRNNLVEHPLRDGRHDVSVQWWHWILNISVRETGVIGELLGGASDTGLNLRSHNPNVSIRCDKD